MKSASGSSHDSRYSGSGIGSTPDHRPKSRSSNGTENMKSSNGGNPLLEALRGVFASCFMPPPEEKSSQKLGDSGQFKVPSDESVSRRDRKSSSNHGSHASLSPLTGKEPGSVKFTMDEIYKATRNFSPSYKIGQGGFGTVYRGKLADGTIVAIKRARKSSLEKHVGVEFRSEIQTLAQVEHLNLVKLYGFLEHEDERIVVVEHVPNGTLREHLDCNRGNVLDFAARLEIAIDVAHAITYLHTYTDRPIIHRDIKSSNILLTDNLRAKVADFGFAKLAADRDSGATHVSTQVKGTAGYLDPEYLRTYQLTEKSDVYSFGVLLVELVTGRRPIEAKRELNERITARWLDMSACTIRMYVKKAMKKFADGDAIKVLDPKVENTAGVEFAIGKTLELALQCMAPRRQSRPSMRRCAEVLWGIRKDYRDLSTNDYGSNSSRSQIS